MACASPTGCSSRTPCEKLHTIDDTVSNKLISAAQKVINRLLSDGIYTNITGFVFHHNSQPGTIFEEKINPPPDELVKYCEKYRSCVEDALYASMLLRQDLKDSHLSEILDDILSFVVTKDDKGKSTNHAALMLKWVAQNGQKKAIVIDVELARRALIYPIPATRNINRLDWSEPKRDFKFKEVNDRLQLEVTGSGPVGIFERVKDEARLISEVSLPVWRALKLTLDGQKLNKKERPFVLSIRVKRHGELGKGLPGTSLITTGKPGPKLSISSPVRFIMGNKHISMQFYTPPHASQPYSNGWQRHTLKVLSTNDGLSVIKLFLDKHKKFGACIRRFLNEVPVKIEDIIEQLRSVIALIQPPPPPPPPPPESLDTDGIDPRVAILDSKNVSEVNNFEILQGNQHEVQPLS